MKTAQFEQFIKLAVIDSVVIFDRTKHGDGFEVYAYHHQIDTPEQERIATEVGRAGNAIEAARGGRRTWKDLARAYEFIRQAGWNGHVLVDFERGGKKIDGINIDPELPTNFYDTPNDQRSAYQIRTWWNVPFIVTTTWEQRRSDATYEEYCDRMATYKTTPSKTRDEWDAEMEQRRQAWFAECPEGVSYAVLRLDGGAWDRPTEYGVHTTLADALVEAKQLEQFGGRS